MPPGAAPRVNAPSLPRAASLRHALQRAQQAWPRAGARLAATPVFYGLLAGLVLALYAPSLRFGLIWDDPEWYRQGAGQSLWQLFTALPSYQFYRPLAILLNRTLVSPVGAVNAPAAHAIQIEAHLASTLLLAPVLHALGLGRRQARLAALLFAVFPLSYQAVAWQAPQQPLALFWVLLALWLAAQASRGRPWLGLSLSVSAYAAGLLFQESALPFALAFVWLAVVQRRAGPSRLPAAWPLLHLAVAGAYTLVWLSVPRKAGVTGAGFDPQVAAYLLQGVVFPLAHALTGWAVRWSSAGLVALFATASGLLAAAVWRWTSRRAALLSVAWIGLGLLPAWAGLSWEYVRIGERVFYPAAPGVAVLWAGVVVWMARGPRWRRAAGLAAAAALLSVSIWQGLQFYQLYRMGTSFLAETVGLLSAQPAGRLVFVNYPDRLEIRPPIYPRGNWGLILAPVGLGLSGFAVAATGQSAAEQSLAVFAFGVPDREAWPYRLDLRGTDTSAEGLVEAALGADAVYVTDYRPSGQMRLREVGAIRPLAGQAPPVAVFDQAVQLLRAEVQSGDRPGLRLMWSRQQPLEYDTTVFVHFWQGDDFRGGADGDSLGGLVPLFVWPSGAAIEDVRAFDDLPYEPGAYEVRIGLYRRDTLERLPALAADGTRYVDDSVPVGMVELP